MPSPATTKGSNASVAEVSAEQAADLLDQVLARTPAAVKAVAIQTSLERRLDTIRALLPERLRPDATRLIKRAVAYVNHNERVQECSPASIVRCVLQAAEVGLCLDGRLAHAVGRNCKVSGKGEPPRWEKQASLNVDYKGLLAIAKRSGQLDAGDARIVYEGEEFECYSDGDLDVLRHRPAVRDAERGMVLGAWARIVLPGGRLRVDWMTIGDIQRIQALSPAAAKEDGPWVKHFNEMAKKTVLRRLLKLYCDDQGLLDLFDREDREWSTPDGDAVAPDETSRTERTVSRTDALAERLAGKAAKRPAAPSAPAASDDERDDESIETDELPAPLDPNDPPEPPEATDEYAREPGDEAQPYRAPKRTGELFDRGRKSATEAGY